MNLKMVGGAVLAGLLVVSVNAADDDAPKKKRQAKGQQNAANQLLKQLEPVGLSDEQVEKIKELGKAAAASMKQIRDDAGITPALMKKRTEVQKSMKDSGKKGKELIAAINKEAGISEEQAAGLAKVTAARQKFQREVIAMLSDEQKEKLPQNLQRVAKAGAKGKAGEKGKGKKKKDDA